MEMTDPGAIHTDAEFHRLFEEIYPAVRLHCYRLIGSSDEADDATQDVFLAVYQGLSGFRGECSLFTWVYRIATRIAIRHRARMKRRNVQPVADRALQTEAPVLRHQIERAIAKLSFEHATVLSLFAVKALSHQEIAAILGIPEGTVWSRLHTARKKLADELNWNT